MPPSKNSLAVFARFPTPGAAKTRLIPALGPEGAANLHRQMTEGAIRLAQAFCRHSDTALEILFCGGSVAAMRQWLGPHTFIPQQEGSLGERMSHTFRKSFAAGASKVVIIGTDCPGLTLGILGQAFAALNDHTLVLGPALDGGYYLIGLNRPCPFLFTGIDWGTSAVLTQTLALAQCLAVHLLPALHDIDRPGDLAHLNYHPHP